MGLVRYAQRLIEVPLTTVNATAAAIPAGVTEGTTGASSSVRRVRFNFAGYTQWRLAGRIATASAAGTKAAVQWSLDEVTWKYLDDVTSGSAPGASAYLSLAAIATPVTSFLSIPAAARADVFLRCVTLDGDGATTGSMGHLAVQAK
jgi:hypothetical protein